MNMKSLSKELESRVDGWLDKFVGRSANHPMAGQTWIS